MRRDSLHLGHRAYSAAIALVRRSSQRRLLKLKQQPGRFCQYTPGGANCALGSKLPWLIPRVVLSEDEDKRWRYYGYHISVGT